MHARTQMRTHMHADAHARTQMRTHAHACVRLHARAHTRTLQVMGALQTIEANGGPAALLAIKAKVPTYNTINLL